MERDKRSTSFEDVDELERHKQSHDAETKEGAVVGSGTGSQRQGVSLLDSQTAKTPTAADGSTEEARSEREIAEGQRNDLTNALANRETLYDHRDNSEWEVNPNQTPKQTKAIRPINYV